MPNELLTISMITREAVRLFTNTNMFIQNIDRQYDDQFAQSGAKIGTQLRIRLPNDYIVSDGPAASVQDTNEQQVVLALATQRHVDVAFTTAERTLSLDDYGERILKPKVNVLAGNVAAEIMHGSEGGICNLVFNNDGAGGILRPNQETYLEAGATLDDNSAPLLGTRGDRKVVNDPHTDARVTSSLSGLFNPAARISEQYEFGMMKQALGFSWFRDQTVIKHTVGTFTNGQVNGANQEGDILDVHAITGTLLQGDVVTVDNVNAVNRVTKEDTGILRQFVLTEDAAAGATTLNIYPAIVASDAGEAVQYQTVENAPADNSHVELVINPGTVYRKSFCYAPEAITMVTADMELPAKGIVEGARHQFDGVSMRSIAAYAIGTDQIIDRLDVLFGFLYVRPEWACIVADQI